MSPVYKEINTDTAADRSNSVAEDQFPADASPLAELKELSAVGMVVRTGEEESGTDPGCSCIVIKKGYLRADRREEVVGKPPD